MAITDNIIAAYKLENVNDEVGGYTLTNNNTATFSAGKFNNGVELGSSNTNKNLEVSNGMGFTYTSSESISCWVKINTAPGAGVSTTLVGHMFATNPGNYRIIMYRDYLGTKQILTNTGSLYNYTLTVGTWYHLVLTYNHSGNAVKLYLNGSICYTDASFSSNYSTYTTKFSIGNFVGVQYSSEMVDDVVVWSRIITQTEIDTIYNSGTGLAYPFTPPASGPANAKTINGLTEASVKTINGLATASVKSINGLT